MALLRRAVRLWGAAPRAPRPVCDIRWARRRGGRAFSTSGQEYWAQLWSQEGADVFTLEEPNENLVRFADSLLPPAREAQRGGPPGSTVLVPLCGRSVDMAWLAQQGHAVVGIDCIAEPLRRFANECTGGLEPVSEDARLSVYRCRHLRRIILIKGDFLELAPDDLTQRFDGVWDRGGLTAVPPVQRVAYCRQLQGLLQPGGRVLLELLCCNLPLEGAMEAEEAERLLRDAGFVGISRLREADVRHEYPGFNPPGLAYLREVVLLGVKPEEERAEVAAAAAATTPSNAAEASSATLQRLEEPLR
jgi:thiopurine S-methyltransferase